MRFVRSLLALLVVLGLAITPVAAKATVATPQSPHQAGAESDRAGMLDCHRALMQMAAHHELAHRAMGDDITANQDGDRKDCPDCAKHHPCTADLCQLKCFKVLGFTTVLSKVIPVTALVYDDLAPRDPDPVDWKPRTPPPRS